MMVGVSIWFMADKELQRDFEWYVRTKKFFAFNSDSATGERAKTIDNFKVRNDALRIKIENRINALFPDTEFILGQRVVDPSEINGTSPQERLKNAITKHLERVYSKNHLTQNYVRNQSELRDLMKRGVQSSLELDAAEQEVNDFITARGDELSVEDIIKHFEKAPFGWKFEAVLQALFQLEAKKKREFVYQNSPRYPSRDFIEHAMKTSERAVCIVRAGEEIPQSTLDAVQDHFKYVFNKDLTRSTNGGELFDYLKAELDRIYISYEKDEDTFYGAYPFGVVFHQLRKKLEDLKTSREPKTLFKRLEDQKEDLKQAFDLAKGMAELMSRAKGDYDAIREFHKNNQENIRELSPEAMEKGEKIADFLRSDDPRHDLRHIIKAYRELKDELNAWMDQLRNEVVQLYEGIFEELEEKAQSMGITESAVYADRDTHLAQIRKISSITQLKLRQSQANAFKADELEKTIRFASKKQSSSGVGQKVNEPKEYYLTRVKATISTEEELEAYLEQVKKDMLDLIRNNKTIIIK